MNAMSSQAYWLRRRRDDPAARVASRDSVAQNANLNRDDGHSPGTVPKQRFGRYQERDDSGIFSPQSPDSPIQEFHPDLSASLYQLTPLRASGINNDEEDDEREIESPQLSDSPNGSTHTSSDDGRDLYGPGTPEESGDSPNGSVHTPSLNSSLNLPISGPPEDSDSSDDSMHTPSLDSGHDFLSENVREQMEQGSRIQAVESYRRTICLCSSFAFLLLLLCYVLYCVMYSDIPLWEMLWLSSNTSSP